MTDAACFSLSDGTPVRPSNPFFITGSGRCGTTLLRRLVMQRADVIIPPENRSLAASPRIIEACGEDWGLFCRLVFNYLQQATASSLHFGDDWVLVMVLLQNIPREVRTVANFWHAFHALYAARLNRPGDTRWGDKTPSNTVDLPNLVEVFPQARFVFLVRDVFDSAYSYGSMSAADRPGQYWDGARRWVLTNSHILAFAERFPEQTTLLCYEDLVRFPGRAVARVLQHLRLPSVTPRALVPAETQDIANAAHLSNALGDVSSNYIGKGRAGLTRHDKHRIAGIAASLQLWFGYEPSGLDCFPLAGAAPWNGQE